MMHTCIRPHGWFLKFCGMDIFNDIVELSIIQKLDDIFPEEHNDN